MKIRPIIWITIKYKDNVFDVGCCHKTFEIKEIRSIDSEINIAPLPSLEVKREIQDLIIAKGTHHAI